MTTKLCTFRLLRMSYLPKESLTLTGGCYCKAIRYTVKVPAWQDRAPVPGALETPISVDEKVETRMPLIDIDHCDTCRHASGAMVQCWLIPPVTWVEWELLPKQSPPGSDSGGDKAHQPLHMSTVEAVGPLEENNNPPSTYVARFNCTTRATRTFCSRCGTNLTYVSHKYLNTPRAFVDITIGSLDEESLKLAKPDRHGWWDFGIDWVKSLMRGKDGGFLIRHQTGDVSRAVED